jgi:hypothetical protein
MAERSLVLQQRSRKAMIERIEIRLAIAKDTVRMP